MSERVIIRRESSTNLNKEREYVKAIKNGRECALRLNRVNGIDIRNGLWKGQVSLGTYYNGVILDAELYAETLEDTLEEMKSEWGYKNLKLISKKEFEDFEVVDGENYNFIKWGKEVVNEIK